MTSRNIASVALVMASSLGVSFGCASEGEATDGEELAATDGPTQTAPVTSPGPGPSATTPGNASVPPASSPSPAADGGSGPVAQPPLGGGAGGTTPSAMPSSENGGAPVANGGSAGEAPSGGGGNSANAGGGGEAAGGSGAGASAGGGAQNPGGAGGTPNAGGGTSVDTDGATYLPDPGWACGMEGGIPDPTLGELAFTMEFEISAEHEVGETQYGFRRLLDVSGGTISGDQLQGSVLTGGLEYELTLANGVMEYQGINILQGGDGSRVFVRSCGVAPDADSKARIIPDFEATTSGAYAFLNTGTWVATREVTNGKMTLDVYDVSGVTPGEPNIELTKPDGVEPQPWECNKTTGSQGAQVLTENVTLGSSFSIANAKYGSRNVIPITGGTTSGRVTGAILNGGADYQLSGSLDAWYTLAPDNGEFILVRNCGGANGLIPWFEAKVDGDYAFLNTQAYLSSSPGVGAGGVTITFYERN